MKSPGSGSIGRESIVEAAKRAASRLGVPSLSLREFEAETGIHPHYIQKCFPTGGWTEVTRLAALKAHRGSANPYGDDVLLEKYHKVTTKLGRIPTWAQLAAETPASSTIRQRFGGLPGTLEKYAAWLRSEQPTSPMLPLVEAKLRGSRPARPRPPDERTANAHVVALGAKDLGALRAFPAHLRREAELMSRQYVVLYCLERSLRMLIERQLRERYGPGWWAASVPKVVQDEADRNRARERDAGVTPRSDRPLDYATLGQLGEILAANWPDFRGAFKSQKVVQRVLPLLNTLRGPIAHNSPLPEDEITRLGLAVRDWLRNLSAP